MTDHSELKRLAEGAIQAGDHWGRRDSYERQLAKLATPEWVLSVIAEIKRISIREDVLENLCDTRFRINLDLETERDKLKAENEKLKSACSRADQIICDESKEASFARARENLLEADLEKLKAEVEALRDALCGVMEQVEGNIRVTVRDCVNGMDDVQDIYEYCDNVEAIVDLAMSKGDQP